MGTTLRIMFFLTLLVSTSGCKPDRFDAQQYSHLGSRYDVVIRRDHRGVPHILGTTDADTAFGFAYAQAEDNWVLIEDALPFYRGNSALFNGAEGAITDYLVKWLGLWDALEENYTWDLSPETRRYVQAFADGLNYYAARHPEKIDSRKLPVTPRDIVAGFMLRHLMFYGFDGIVREVNQAERQREISLGEGTLNPTISQTPVTIGELPIGSNAFAIARHFSEEGATRLAINSHQPTQGPVAWYEAHIQSKDGLNIMGGVFPGSPSISVGFTEHLAWGATVNQPDLVDVYVLEINPNNPDQYRIDGTWRTLTRSTVDIPLTLWGFFPWTVSREILASEHGPVLRTDHGTYAVRYAGMGELRQVEQWYRMNKATDFDEWRDAMSMMSFASFNFVYADRDDNIMFLHNSLTPRRQPNYDWQQYLPGNDSMLIWTENLSFSQLPQVINPSSGFVHSANQTPFNVTAAADNPNRADFKPEHGFQTNMTNRAQRGLELFSAWGPISEAEFSAIKHDKYYSPQTPYVGYLDKVAAIKLSDPALKQAQQLLNDWDLGTYIQNTHAAMGTCVLLAAEKDSNSNAHEAHQITQLIQGCVDLLMASRGKIDPPWGEVNRHVRGDLNLPVGGGPDVLRAIYGRGMKENGYLTNVAGDGLYYLVSWAADGTQTVRGLHQFGSATLDASSPHYADQAQDYVNEILHDPLFSETALQKNLQRAYAPGEE